MDNNSNGTRVGAKCGRWNPTAQQVKVLTDLFASGLRSPTTDQIQMISAHLSSFGKIESKNVFYWFQNHKARERHHKKRRRNGGSCSGGDVCFKTPDKKEAKSCAKIVEHEVNWQLRDQNDEIETLQLFPVSSYNNWEMDKLMAARNGWTEIQVFDAEKDYIPTLDLQLSFL